MSTWAIMFLILTLVTVSVIFFLVNRMANRLRQIPPTERRISSNFLELPWVIREHERLFPRSEPMLAFWLSVEFLLVWLTCMLFSLAIGF
jgi:hypothetical protein